LNERFHPATCGGNRSDDAHKRYAEEHGESDYGILVNGVCPVCGWKQPKDIGTQLHEANLKCRKLTLALQRINNLEASPPLSTDASVFAAMKHIARHALADAGVTQ